MDPQTERTRGWWRDLLAPDRSMGRRVVKALALFVLTVNLLSIFSVSREYATVADIRVDERGVVLWSAMAGVKQGERLDFAASDLSARLALVGGRSLSPDARVTAVFVGDAGRQAVTLATSRDRLPWFYAVKRLAGVAFVLLAWLIYWIAPGRMAWGFFIFGLSAADNNITFFNFLYPSLFFSLWTVLDLLSQLAPAGFLVFANHFQSTRPAATLQRVDRIAIAGALVLSAISVLIKVELVFLQVGLPLGLLRVVAHALEFAGYAGGVAHIVANCVRAAAGERDKTILVAVGVGVAGVVRLLSSWDVGSGASWMPAPWREGAYLNVLAIALPAALLYAIRKHRVMAIQLAVSRVAVLATVGLTVLVVFLLLEQQIHHMVAHISEDRLLQPLALIAAGIAMNWVHHHVDHFLRHRILHEESAGLRALQERGRQLQGADSASAIYDALAETPASALHLRSTAVFVDSGHSGFVRHPTSFGWDDSDAPSTLGNDGPVVRMLNEHHGPVTLASMPCGNTAMGTGNVPALGVPVRQEGRLMAFALYGSHADGRDLTADESAALGHLAEASAAALVLVELRQLRVRTRQLEATLACGADPTPVPAP